MVAQLYFKGGDLCRGEGAGEGDTRVVHCDVDSMDLGLLIGVHFKIGGRNVVSDKY